MSTVVNMPQSRQRARSQTVHLQMRGGAFRSSFHGPLEILEQFLSFFPRFGFTISARLNEEWSVGI